MIDVVFLLLLFFLLTSHLKSTAIISVETSGQTGSALGVNELVLVELGVENSLNGEVISAQNLNRYFMNSPENEQTVAIRPDQTLSSQDLLEFRALLGRHGWTNIVLVETKP